MNVWTSRAPFRKCKRQKVLNQNRVMREKPSAKILNCLKYGSATVSALLFQCYCIVQSFLAFFLTNPHLLHIPFYLSLCSVESSPSTAIGWLVCSAARFLLPFGFLSPCWLLFCCIFFRCEGCWVKGNQTTSIFFIFLLYYKSSKIVVFHSRL